MNAKICTQKLVFLNVLRQDNFGMHAGAQIETKTIQTLEGCQPYDFGKPTDTPVISFWPVQKSSGNGRFYEEKSLFRNIEDIRPIPVFVIDSRKSMIAGNKVEG